jgi:hypothetical protein
MSNDDGQSPPIPAITERDTAGVVAYGTTQCRILELRRCPAYGCVGKLCARLEDDDESRWLAR